MRCPHRDGTSQAVARQDQAHGGTAHLVQHPLQSGAHVTDQSVRGQVLLPAGLPTFRIQQLCFPCDPKSTSEDEEM